MGSMPFYLTLDRIERCELQGLWTGVIVQMIQDMKNKSDKSHQRAAKRDAIAWLNSRDFETVCDYAGFNPYYIRRMIKAAEQRGFEWRLPMGEGWRVQAKLKELA